MGRGSATSLAPGFRFHPTDEELVRYYLKRKVTGKAFRFDPISVVDIYKSEPWDLPSKSKLKTRDLEWYFFSALDRKYGNSSRTNRATEKGYWKTTGKDRAVQHNSRTVGMKKTLVYHSGRAPRGARTNWVMHEYRLVDEQLEKAGIGMDAFVLCRVFQKSGTGPKNGEKYGAPLIEEEWEDEDEGSFVPGEEAAVDEAVAGGDAYVEAADLDQELGITIPPEDTLPSLNFYYGDSSNHAEHYGDFIEDYQKPLIGSGEASELPQDHEFLQMPEQYGMDSKLVKDEFFVQSSDEMESAKFNYSLDEPYLDATDNPPLGDRLYIESNDLTEPVEVDPASFDVLDEYLTFFNADDDNSQYMCFDPSEIMGTDGLVSDQASLTQMQENGGNDQMSMGNLHLLKEEGSNGASSSEQKPEAEIYESDIKSPFIKQAHSMLGSIPAPQALALEFPGKEAALRLNSAAQSSSSAHVTAGMVRIRNLTLSGNGTDFLVGKNGDVNFILPFSMSHGYGDSATLVPGTGKTSSVVSRGWFFLMFFWILILCVSFKMASCIYMVKVKNH